MVTYTHNEFPNRSPNTSENGGTPTSAFYTKNGIPKGSPTTLSPGQRSSTLSSSLSFSPPSSSAKWMGWAIAITSMYGFFKSYYISRKYINKPVEVTDIDVFPNAIHSSNQHTARRTSTDTGLDLMDKSIFTATDNIVPGDSSTTTVIAVATSYDLETYQRFAGPLRKSGYKGKIIIGIHQDFEQEILNYLKFCDHCIKST